MKVMLVVNSAWNVVNFRSGLIRALVATGYTVVVVAPYDQHAVKIEGLGCRYLPLSMDNKGMNPWRDLKLMARLFLLMRLERPDIFLGYTVKPNIYGSLAAHVLKIPAINNIAGLGTVFIQEGMLSRMVKIMYRIALYRSVRVFFQNDDDRLLFTTQRLVPNRSCDILPGSGVDLLKFRPVALPSRPLLRFLLVARVLWDKGIGEYVKAAELLQRRGIKAECCLLGFIDVQNPTAISKDQIVAWTEKGFVSYLGATDDVAEEIARADCVVLPSYREGTPRALLEAAAMARPIVASNATGCREVVEDGVNGYLCRPRDPHDLAEKMERMVKLSRTDREAMGLRGRQKIERQFDEQFVIRKYLNILEQTGNLSNREG